MNALRLVVALVPFVSGCGWMPELEPSTQGFENSGSLCFSSTSDGSVQVVVAFDTCLSSSCDRVLGASCRISESRGEITVTSRATVEHDSGECTTDCRVLTARCESRPIAPGTYAVKYGAALGEVSLPANKTELFADFPTNTCR